MSDPLFQMQTFANGSFITIEGARNGNQFHIITDGQVILKKKNPISGDDASQYLGKGDFFGVITAMTGLPHLETASASGNVGVISVARDRFADLIRRNTPLAMKIIRSYSLRLRQLDALLHYKKGNVEDPIEEAILIADGTIDFGNKEMASYMYQNILEMYPEGDHRAKCMAKLNYLNKSTEKPKKTGNMRTYDVGEIIFCEGEVGKELFIVQAGRVKIFKYVKGQEVVLNVMKDGDIFGELALIDNKPRYASAMPMELSNIITISKQNFSTITETNPGLMAKVITVLSERVWTSYKKTVNAKLADINYRFADMLLLLAEQARAKIAPKIKYNFNMTPEDFLRMVGTTESDMPNLLRFIKAHQFLNNDGNTIVCTDLGLLERAVKGFKDRFSRT